MAMAGVVECMLVKPSPDTPTRMVESPVLPRKGNIGKEEGTIIVG